MNDRAASRAVIHSHGCEPWVPKPEFKIETLAAERTPLAEALKGNDLTFRTWDLTFQDFALAERRRMALEELKPLFEKEGTMFLYKNRLGDAEGITKAVKEGLHRRYFYMINLSEDAAS